MKRIIAALLLFVILLSALVPVLAAAEHETDGQILKELGILTGNEDGNLMLDDNFKRQDMVVMISRLYGKEDEAKSYSGTNTFKDLGKSQSFYIPYINWARDKGLIQGMSSDEFGFNRFTRVQEFQVVLLRVLGYGEYARDWNSVPLYAKTLGIMEKLEDLDPNKNLTRGQMATMVLNALELNMNKMNFHTLADVLGLDMSKFLRIRHELAIDDNTIAITGKARGAKNLRLHVRPRSKVSIGAILKDIALDDEGNFLVVVDKLQEGDYEYRFESDNGNTAFKPFSIENVKFALLDVYADNLKEINLVFTKAVDRNTAAVTNNYSTLEGSVKEVRFEDEDKRIVLVLNGMMKQEGINKINAWVRSFDGESLEVSDLEFKAADLEYPTILEIVQLGNKGLKIVFSEPIKEASIDNFQINGKTPSAKVTLNNNVAILSFEPSYTLGEGKHKLSTTGLMDYANYPLSPSQVEFTIANDTRAPKVKKAFATIDEVIIEFDEDLDPSTVSKDNFYWKLDTSKRKPYGVRVDGSVVILDFSNNRLNTNQATTIYVEKIADYAGNKVEITEVEVTPLLDTNPPEVIDIRVSEDGTSLVVYFSKDVYGNNKNNYTIKDQAGNTIAIKDIRGKGNEYVLNLDTSLPEGINTITIEGIKDTSPLNNSLKAYTKIIKVEGKPEITYYYGSGNRIKVQFSKAMDEKTIMNKDNYLIEFKGSTYKLPEDSLISLSKDDGKELTIVLPERYFGNDLIVGENLTLLEIRGLKDTSGNDLAGYLASLKFDSASGYAETIDYDPAIPGKQAVLVDEHTIKVKFNMPIIQADKKDFNFKKGSISRVEVDGSNEVTLVLDQLQATIPDNSLEIKADNKILTDVGSGAKKGVIQVIDRVSPRVKPDISSLNVRGSIIELPFTEELEAEGESLYRRDLIIYREEDGKVLSKDEYSTSLKSDDKSVLEIILKDSSLASHYTVRVSGEFNPNPSYIRDKYGNPALESDALRTESKIGKTTR